MKAAICIYNPNPNRKVDEGYDVIKAAVRQDRGTGLAIKSFLEASTPRNKNLRASRSGHAGLTPEDMAEAMELALQSDLDRLASPQPGSLRTEWQAQCLTQQQQLPTCAGYASMSRQRSI